MLSHSFLVRLASALLLSILCAWWFPSQVGADWRHDEGKPAYKQDEGRGYQQNSVRTVQQDAQSGVGWIRSKLAPLYVTPARLALGLGLLALLITFNRNKRHLHWALLNAIGWLLLLFGAAAMYFDWQTFNW